MFPVWIFIFKSIYFIYLVLAALSLHYCVWAFSSCDEQGLLIAVASLVAEHGLYVHRLQ